MHRLSYSTTLQSVLFNAEVVVAPPFVFLTLVKSLLRSDFAVAAQNAWVKKGGAFTGEIRFAIFVSVNS